MVTLERFGEHLANEAQRVLPFSIIDPLCRLVLIVEADTQVKFDKVLAVVDGDTQKFGTPIVEGATVTGTVLKNGKSRKVIVYKMHPKKGYRRKQGHRQPYTKVRIDSISL